MDHPPSSNIYLNSWFILSVLFFTDSETSVVSTHVLVPNHMELHPLHVPWIPNHTDLHPGRNVYLTSWFILSVLFLTDGETSVVPTHVRDPTSYGPPSQ